MLSDYFAFIKEKHLKPTLYTFYIFNAITNKIALKNQIQEIKQKLDNEYENKELQNKNVNDIVKIMAGTLSTMSLSPNDLILSGILDVPTLKREKSPIMKELKKAKLWKLVNEPIEFLSSPDDVEQFVIKCIENKNHNIKIPKKHASLFVRIKNLVDSMDAVTSQATLGRNSAKGPIKKYDIFGVNKNENYDLELILGKISYGPLDETYKHTTEDRIKLGKGAKDSLDTSIEIPFKRGSNLLELIKAAHTFRSLIEETLVNIRLFHKSTKNEDDDRDDDGDEESESGDEIDDETKDEENEIGES
ncbi:hypothetical protein F8M41_021374 [Gigaspora margarita]|uniref:Uncharacterized protein n=1 Tax=Gigaspora margarita TaxID=4874 RepID=A0A8H4AGU3_GIGMA|nr:hypothetical protein F8M41_021374 [Gigaspora margarita]